jgi:hypothetical protein
VTQPLLNEIKSLCRARGVWLSLDPKPVHHLNLSGLSLITPNRKEAFELANLPDETRHANPLADKNLMLVAERLLNELRPAVLLITLGELGMLLCQRGQKPFHIPRSRRKCSMFPARATRSSRRSLWPSPPELRRLKRRFCQITPLELWSAKSARQRLRRRNCWQVLKNVKSLHR